MFDNMPQVSAYLLYSSSQSSVTDALLTIHIPLVVRAVHQVIQYVSIIGEEPIVKCKQT